MVAKKVKQWERKQFDGSNMGDYRTSVATEEKDRANNMDKETNSRRRILSVEEWMCVGDLPKVCHPLAESIGTTNIGESQG